MRSLQLLRQHHPCHKCENRRQQVQYENHSRDSQTLDENRSDSNEPSDPGVSCDVHGVVDGTVCAGLAGQHVADQGGDEDDPDELDGPEDGLGDGYHCWIGAMARDEGI